MSDHTSIRLETPGGTVIAYFAPNFRVEPVFKNNLFANARPGDDASIVRDQQLVRHQVVVQGAFEDSDNLPSAHATDLENLFGTSPVTARQQVNRIKHYMATQGGPFYFYDGSDTYTAESKSAIDRSAGTFPVVNIDEFRPPSEGGLTRFEYMVKMEVGLER